MVLIIPKKKAAYGYGPSIQCSHIYPHGQEQYSEHTVHSINCFWQTKGRDVKMRLGTILDSNHYRL